MHIKNKYMTLITLSTLTWLCFYFTDLGASPHLRYNAARFISTIERNKTQNIEKKIQSLISSILKEKNEKNANRYLTQLQKFPKSLIIHLWLQRLSDTRNINRKIRIIQYLPENNSRVIVMPVAKYLKSPYQKLRNAAAKALGKIGDDRLYPLILGMAKSKNPVYRIYFIEAMNHLYDRRFYYLLTGLIHDSSKSVRIYVLKCLKNNRLTEALPIIRNSALHDNNSEVKIAAINAIGEIRDTGSISILHSLLNNRDNEIRKETIKALARIAYSSSAIPLSSRLLVEQNTQIKTLLIDTLIKIRKTGDIRGIEKILLNDAAVRLRIKCAYLLGISRNNRALNTLVKGLHDPDFRVRAEICNSLGYYRTKSIVPTLLTIIRKDSLRYVKTAALYSIKRLNDRKAVLSLFDIYSREQDPVFKDILRNIIRQFIVKFL